MTGKASHRAHAAQNSKKRRKQREKVIAYWGLICFYCSLKLALHEVTMDHYWPLKLCCDLDLPTWLREHVDNKRVACLTCNNKKADEIPGSMNEFWSWVRLRMAIREEEQREESSKCKSN